MFFDEFSGVPVDDEDNDGRRVHSIVILRRLEHGMKIEKVDVDHALRWPASPEVSLPVTDTARTGTPVRKL